ncbi:MAG: ribosome maturation factor RimP [Candidatus Wallbacteria bacterium]|nr:ribosome maturation factor RimP [Candidatus Wallbacteria bacterium]
MNPVSKELQTKVWDIVRPLTDVLGFELVDIEFVGGHRSATVRLVIDSEKGVSLEDCAKLSRAVSERFDAEQTFEQPHTLEVSSPGIDRPFWNLASYRRAMGRKIDVVLAEPLGKATFFRGVLKSVDEKGIVLVPEKGEELAIGFANIRRAHRTLEF